MEQFFEAIGKVVAVAGGAAAIAYALFIFLGKRWIEDKFAMRLEVYKNEQKKNLQDFKYQIDTLFNRVLKIHDKEMEVLPEAWSKLHDAVDHISSLVNVWQQYPNFTIQKEADIVSYLESLKWKKHQIDDLLNAHDRNKHFQEKIFWHRYNEAQRMFSEFHKYIIRNKIFMGEELKEHFTKVGDLLWESLITREIGEGTKDHEMMVESYKKLKDNLDEIVNDIELLMQKRLRYHDAI